MFGAFKSLPEERESPGWWLCLCGSHRIAKLQSFISRDVFCLIPKWSQLAASSICLDATTVDLVTSALKNIQPTLVTSQRPGGQNLVVVLLLLVVRESFVFWRDEPSLRPLATHTCHRDPPKFTHQGPRCCVQRRGEKLLLTIWWKWISRSQNCRCETSSYLRRGFSEQRPGSGLHNAFKAAQRCRRCLRWQRHCWTVLHQRTETVNSLRTSGWCLDQPISITSIPLLVSVWIENEWKESDT